MLTFGLSHLRPRFAAQTAIFAVPLLLLISPALYYSLDTPFGLLEVGYWRYYTLHSTSKFLEFLYGNFVALDTSVFDSPTWATMRFKPLEEIWRGLAWHIFSDMAWVHYAARWLVHFGAVAFFIAAFMRFYGSSTIAGAPSQKTAGLLRIVPVTLLAYLWLLFPNLPTVRLGAIEPFSILFLALCNYAAALMLTAKKGKPAPGHYAFFLFSFLGLMLWKEVNIAPAFWLLMCYWAWAIASRASVRKVLMGVALSLSFFFAIWRISVAWETAESVNVYYAPMAFNLQDFTDNAHKILQGVFQWETSIVLTAAFVFLLVVLIIGGGYKLARHGLNGELAFILLLLGEFMSVFLAAATSFGVTLRYWSVLVPCFATLLAFAAKFLLQAVVCHKKVPPPPNCAALALGIFIAFFVSANYYNFLYQAIVQHSARNLDALVIAELAPLLNSGQYVHANPYDWNFEEMGELNSLHTHKSHWPLSPYGSHSIHRAPPKNPQQPHYFLDIAGPPDFPGSFHARLVGRTDYDILGYAAKVAELVQGGAPHASLDWGMHKLGWYRWDIHVLRHGPESYVDRLTSAAGTPVAQSVFNVYFDGAKVMYSKEPCHEEDVQDFFFLHLTPERVSDLPKGRVPHGFDNLDFPFKDYGINVGEACLAVRTLPPYPIKSIRTGQYVMKKGTRIWEADFHPRNPSPRQL